MGPGKRIIASNKLYGGSITQFSKTFKKFNWNCTFVDMDNIDEVRGAANGQDVRAVFAESLANPGGVITDISTIKEIANEAGIPLIIDNTMATPFLCQPIEYGADISGCLLLHKAARNGCLELCELLIEKGVDINAKDSKEMTPIHWATENGHLSL